MDNHLILNNGEKLSVPVLMSKLLDLNRTWRFSNSAGRPWFRGQDTIKGPLPSLFRCKYDEFHMNTMFRNRASLFKDAPETDRLDKWLFLSQHYGLPTRLLDWTENPLQALYFALKDYFAQKDELHSKQQADCNDGPSLWVLHPYALNEESDISGFPNTWTVNNRALNYFRLAYHPAKEWCSAIDPCLCKYSLPIAVQANHFSERIYFQQSCFTIHGTEEGDFEKLFQESALVSDGHFYKYVLPTDDIELLFELAKELHFLGIGESSIFPGIEGLAKNLRYRFMIE